MKELQNRIDQLIKTSNCDPTIIDAIKNEQSVPPFSTESRLLSYLLSIGRINYTDYSEIGREYLFDIVVENAVNADPSDSSDMPDNTGHIALIERTGLTETN